MANRKLTDLTKVAQKGLRGFFEAEDGGTSQKAALSMGLLAGGVLMMEHLAAQSAYGDHGNDACRYAQRCGDPVNPPRADECVLKIGDGPDQDGDDCRVIRIGNVSTCNTVSLCNW